MRESYRLNKLELLDAAAQKEKSIRVLFSLTPAAYNRYSKVKFIELSEDMKLMLIKIQSFLNK